MVACPHCGENGINLLSKAWSDSACPSTCSSCGQLSYLPSRYKHALSFTFNLLGLVAAGLALYLLSWWPVVAFLALVVLGYTLTALSVSGVPITGKKAAENKRKGNIFTLAIVVVFIAASLWAHYASASNQAFNAFAGAHWDVPPAAGRPLMQRCA